MIFKIHLQKKKQKGNKINPRCTHILQRVYVPINQNKILDKRCHTFMVDI